MAGALSFIRLPVFNNISTNSTAHNGPQNDSYGFASPQKGNVTGAASAIEEETKNPWSFEFSVIMATILSISAFLTVVGNAMVLTVICRHRGMRTRTNIFLVNLAIADFLVGIMVVPISITTLVEGRWVLGSATCSMNGWVNGLCLITSIHTLMYIGINKYYSICRPLNNPIQLRHIVAMMISAWLWGAFCATITVTGLNTVTDKYGTSQCGPDYPKDVKGYMFHTIIQVTVIILPFCILLFCYIRMFREIKRHSDRLRNNTTVEEDFILNQQKKVAVTLFIVLATFVVMALPYHIYATYTTIKKDKENFSTYINPIAYLFLYLNSMCNPIIYAFRSPAFREGYKEILCQTPNYVIRDGYNSVRSSRANSITPNGRSRLVLSSSSTNTNTDGNESPDLRSPAPLLSAAHGKPRHGSVSTGSSSKGGGSGNILKKRRLFNLHKQPTMKELIRSSRKATGPLVIRRDGDVVVVKSGKIVSVRRESESSSSLLSPTRRLVDHAREIPYGNSIAQVVFSQLTLGTTPTVPVAATAAPDIPRESDEDNSDHDPTCNGSSKNGGVCNGQSALKAVNDRSDDAVFVDKGKMSPELDSPNRALVKGAGSGDMFGDHAASDEYNVSRDPSLHSIEELSMSPVSTNSNSNRERLKDRRNAPDLTVQILPPVESSLPSFNSSHRSTEKIEENISNSHRNKVNHALLALPALSNMVAGVASRTTDILLGMPLTAYTRDTLTKSDQQLNAPNFSGSSHFLMAHQVSSQGYPAASPITHAHSTDNLNRTPKFARYPSLEHLDRPKPLFGTAKSHSGRNHKTSIV